VPLKQVTCINSIEYCLSDCVKYIIYVDHFFSVVIFLFASRMSCKVPHFLFQLPRSHSTRYWLILLADVLGIKNLSCKRLTYDTQSLLIRHRINIVIADCTLSMCTQWYIGLGEYQLEHRTCFVQETRAVI
jgi:hypothetical protein